MNQLLALWSTPRSVSTAFEWMMRQRDDFEVLHEPFQQAYYFGEDRHSTRHQVDPPIVGLTLNSVRTSLFERVERSRTFVKDFPYCFLHAVDDPFIERFRHTFLIRDPAKVLPSLHNHWPDFTLAETGYAGMRDMFDRVERHTGEKPVLIDADDLLADPHETVRRYCDSVGIEFMPKSLAWDAGERNEVRWYGGEWHQGLQQTSGFDQREGGEIDPRYVQVEDDRRLKEAYDACRPLYDELRAQRISGGPNLGRQKPASAGE